MHELTSGIHKTWSDVNERFENHFDPTKEETKNVTDITDPNCHFDLSVEKAAMVPVDHHGTNLKHAIVGNGLDESTPPTEVVPTEKGDRTSRAVFDPLTHKPHLLTREAERDIPTKLDDSLTDMDVSTEKANCDNTKSPSPLNLRNLIG